VDASRPGPRHDGILTPDAVSVGGGVLTIKPYTQAGKHYSGMIVSARSSASSAPARSRAAATARDRRRRRTMQVYVYALV
jgi:hypothetical protein